MGFFLSANADTISVRTTGVKAGPFWMIEDARRAVKGKVWHSIERLTSAIKGGGVA